MDKRFRAAPGLPIDMRVLAEVITTSGDQGQGVRELAQRVGEDVATVEQALFELFRSLQIVEVEPGKFTTEDQHGDPKIIDDDGDITIRMASGRQFHPFAPRPEDFTWSDLSASLCRITRFNGQFPEDGAAGYAEIYSDAQHLCLASDLLVEHMPDASRELQLAVHLHDGEEALGGLGDPVGPVKHSRRMRVVLEPYFREIQNAIAAKAGIDPELLRSPEVKRFDRMAYAIENWHLRRLTKGDGVPRVPKRHTLGSMEFDCWPTRIARTRWTTRLNELLGDV